MSTESQAREANGGLGTIDTQVAAATLATTTAEDFIVPVGKPWITQVTGVFASDGNAAGSAAGLLILWGAVERRQEIPIGAFGAELTTTHSTIANASIIPTNIKCTPGQRIYARFIAVGEDTGTPQAFAELMFSTSPRPGFPKMQYQALEVQTGTVDSWTQLQGLGTAAADTFLVDGNKIKQVLSATAADAQAVGAGTIVARLTGNGLEVEQQLVLSGSGGTHTAEGNGHSPTLVHEVDMVARSGNRITGEIAMVGVDIGTITACVALGYGY